MPVEIYELVVKARIRDTDNSQRSPEGTNEKKCSCAEKNIQDIIEQTLEILNLKNER